MSTDPTRRPTMATDDDVTAAWERLNVHECPPSSSFRACPTCADLALVRADWDRLRTALAAEEEVSWAKAQEADTLRARVAALEAGGRAVLQLINESRGVAGLHRNGDVATWDELRTGGRYEEWLVDFDAALLPTPPRCHKEEHP
jgi:hypothetical protein